MGEVEEETRLSKYYILFDQNFDMPIWFNYLQIHQETPKLLATPKAKLLQQVNFWH